VTPLHWGLPMRRKQAIFRVPVLQLWRYPYKKWQDLIFSSTGFQNVSAVKPTTPQLQGNLLQLDPSTRTCIWALRSREKQNIHDILILNNLTHKALTSRRCPSPQAELNKEKSTVNFDLLGVLLLSGKLSCCPFQCPNESMKLLHVKAEPHQYQLDATVAATTGGHPSLICTHSPPSWKQAAASYLEQLFES